MKWIKNLFDKLMGVLTFKDPEYQLESPGEVTLVDNSNTLLVKPKEKKLDINALLELGVVKKGKHYYNLDGIKVVRIDGVYLTFKEVSELYGVNRGTLYSRYKRGSRGLDLVRPLVKELELT